MNLRNVNFSIETIGPLLFSVINISHKDDPALHKTGPSSDESSFKQRFILGYHLEA